MYPLVHVFSSVFSFLTSLSIFRHLSSIHCKVNSHFLIPCLTYSLQVWSADTTFLWHYIKGEEHRTCFHGSLRLFSPLSQFLGMMMINGSLKCMWSEVHRGKGKLGNHFFKGCGQMMCEIVDKLPSLRFWSGHFFHGLGFISDIAVQSFLRHSLLSGNLS